MLYCNGNMTIFTNKKRNKLEAYIIVEEVAKLKASACSNQNRSAFVYCQHQETRRKTINMFYIYILHNDMLLFFF